MAETTPLPSYPLTSSGKRNWSAAAVRLGQPYPDRNSIPGGGMGFADLIDIVNPLQQLPGVGTVYRAMTGDHISGAASILGGLLFGGPIGFLAGLGTTLVAQVLGGDVGERALASISGSLSQDNQLSSKAYQATGQQSHSAGVNITI